VGLPTSPGTSAGRDERGRDGGDRVRSDGFLPEGPAECSALLASYGLSAVGGFVTLVLHDPAADPLPEAKRAVDRMVSAGADVMVVAAVSGQEGYDQALELDATGWATFWPTWGR